MGTFPIDRFPRVKPLAPSAQEHDRFQNPAAGVPSVVTRAGAHRSTVRGTRHAPAPHADIEPPRRAKRVSELRPLSRRRDVLVRRDARRAGRAEAGGVRPARPLPGPRRDADHEAGQATDRDRPGAGRQGPGRGSDESRGREVRRPRARLGRRATREDRRGVQGESRAGTRDEVARALCPASDGRRGRGRERGGRAGRGLGGLGFARDGRGLGRVGAPLDEEEARHRTVDEQDDENKTRAKAKKKKNRARRRRRRDPSRRVQTRRFDLYARVHAPQGRRRADRVASRHLARERFR